jgi:hypothetical protein
LANEKVLFQGQEVAFVVAEDHQQLVSGERYAHVPDALAVASRLSDSAGQAARDAGFRTTLMVPLRKDNTLLGHISASRQRSKSRLHPGNADSTHNSWSGLSTCSGEHDINVPAVVLSIVSAGIPLHRWGPIPRPVRL